MATQPKCERLTKSGKQCRMYAVVGERYCNIHLGRAIGLPTTLTPQVAEQIVASLRAGNYIVVATKAAGVPRQTFNAWMTRGRSPATRDELYRDFRTRVERARAEAETRAVAQIAQAARHNWQAAAWLLERTAPERWGKPSVRLRDEPVKSEPAVTATPDPFAEVDELAKRRSHVT
jgi:hypothetical protein